MPPAEENNTAYVGMSTSMTRNEEPEREGGAWILLLVHALVWKSIHGI